MCEHILMVLNTLLKLNMSLDDKEDKKRRKMKKATRFYRSFMMELYYEKMLEV